LLRLRTQQWGTSIVLKFVCMAPVYAHHDTVALVVVGRDGSQTRLATWVAIPGHTATPTGSISTPVNQICRGASGFGRQRPSDAAALGL
jgi:hypothetical protein